MKPGGTRHFASDATRGASARLKEFRLDSLGRAGANGTLSIIALGFGKTPHSRTLGWCLFRRDF
jgi:hypothetical protein